MAGNGAGTGTALPCSHRKGPAQLCPAPLHGAATCSSQASTGRLRACWRRRRQTEHSPCGCPPGAAGNGSRSTTANSISVAAVRANKHGGSAGSKGCRYSVIAGNHPLYNKFCSICSILKGQPFRQPFVTACFPETKEPFPHVNNVRAERMCGNVCV